MTPPVRRIGIAGVGLIGGSIALATRRSFAGVEIVGYEPDDGHAADNVLDRRVSSLADLADVELIFTCVPMAALPEAFRGLAATGTRAVITDVGSTKRGPVRAAAAAGLASFVGGHPMAGSETSGLGAARANLFDRRPWLLVEGSATSDAGRLVEAFVNGLGAESRWMDAETHDRVVAYVSHLPQVIAAALMKAADGAVPVEGPQTAGYAFAEMTRLASSPASMWETVLDENADFVREALERFLAELPASQEPPGQWAKEALPESGAARARWKRAR